MTRKPKTGPCVTRQRRSQASEARFIHASTRLPQISVGMVPASAAEKLSGSEGITPNGRITASNVILIALSLLVRGYCRAAERPA